MSRYWDGLGFAYAFLWVLKGLVLKIYETFNHSITFSTSNLILRYFFTISPDTPYIDIELNILKLIDNCHIEFDRTNRIVSSVVLITIVLKGTVRENYYYYSNNIEVKKK